MGVRRRPAFLVAAVLAVLAAGSAAALAQTAPEDLCALAPDGAAQTTPRYFGDTPACVLFYGPNDDGTYDAGIILFGFADPAAAKASLDETRGQWDLPGTTLTEIDVGDAGLEWDARGTSAVPDYTWAFARGPVVVWVDASTAFEPERAGMVVDLARATDALLTERFGSEPGSPPPGSGATTTTIPVTTTVVPPTTTTRPPDDPPSGTAGPGGDGLATAGDVSGIAEEIMVAALDPDGGVFGTAEADLWDVVSAATGCPFGGFVDALTLRSPAGDIPDMCRIAAERAGQAMATLTDDAAGAYPDLGDEGVLPMAARAQSTAALHAAVAVYLANLDAGDDTALFPGIRAAEPVIMIMGRGGVLGVERSQISLSRFISLTVGRDLLSWEGA